MVTSWPIQLCAGGVTVAYRAAFELVNCGPKRKIGGDRFNRRPWIARPERLLTLPGPRFSVRALLPARRSTPCRARARTHRRSAALAPAAAAARQAESGR